MRVDRHGGVSRALAISRSSLCGKVVFGIFFSFLSSQSCRLTIGSRVHWKVQAALLGKDYCYVKQLGSNTRTLGSVKAASWFWVGQPGSSAAQGSFAAARQTLRHVGESNLIWFFLFLNCCLDIIFARYLLKWGFYASPSWRGRREVLYRASRLLCFGFVCFIHCSSQELILLRACSVMYVCCILLFHCSRWAWIVCCKHDSVSYVTCFGHNHFCAG